MNCDTASDEHDRYIGVCSDFEMRAHWLAGELFSLEDQQAQREWWAQYYAAADRVRGFR